MSTRNHIRNVVRKANVACRTDTRTPYGTTVIRIPRICRVPDEHHARSVGNTTSGFSVQPMERNIRESAYTTRCRLRQARWTNPRRSQTNHRGRDPTTSIMIPCAVRRPSNQPIRISVESSTRVRAQSSEDAARRVARRRVLETRNPRVAELQTSPTVRRVLSTRPRTAVTTRETCQESYRYQKMLHD